MAKFSPIQLARFWSRVQTSTDFQCWEWQGVTDAKGYGRYDNQLAHRLAYYFVSGPIPDGMVIRHKCDNPPCCNPKHLEVGTQRENIHDAVARGRIAKGKRHGRSKLSDAQVALIHTNPDKLTLTKLAETLGVAKSTVSMIKAGKRRG